MCFLAKGKELTHHRWFPRDPSHSNQPDPCWPNLRSLKSNVLSHRLRNKCLWAGTRAFTLYKQELSLVTGVNASWAVPLLIPFSSNLVQQVSFRHANYGSSEPALPQCKDCPPVWQHLHVAMTEFHEPSSWAPLGMVPTAHQNDGQPLAPQGCTPRHFVISAISQSQPTAWTKQGIGTGGRGFISKTTDSCGMVNKHGKTSVYPNLVCLRLTLKSCWLVKCKSAAAQESLWEE